MNTEPKTSWQRKTVSFVLIMLGFAALGYFFGRYLGRTMGSSGTDLDFNVSVIVAGSIAAFYIFMGLLVAVGTAFPKLGALILNTYGEDELREERPKLVCSAGAASCFGLALLALVLAGVDMLTSIQGAAAFFGLMIASCGFYLPMMRTMDELDWQMSREAVSYTYYALLLVGGSWAALAHLELVKGPAMLDWLSMFWGLMLAATMVAAGRRGLLNKG